MPHSWDENTPLKSYSTCNNCGLTEKTWKVKKRGRLPTCEDYKQTKLDEKPPCSKGKPPQACYNCHARLNQETCDNLRQTLKIFNSTKQTQKQEKTPPIEEE